MYFFIVIPRVRQTKHVHFVCLKGRIQVVWETRRVNWIKKPNVLQICNTTPTFVSSSFSILGMCMFVQKFSDFIIVVSSSIRSVRTAHLQHCNKQTWYRLYSWAVTSTRILLNAQSKHVRKHNPASRIRVYTTIYVLEAASGKSLSQL